MKALTVKGGCGGEEEEEEEGKICSEGELEGSGRYTCLAAEDTFLLVGQLSSAAIENSTSGWIDTHRETDRQTG